MHYDDLLVDKQVVDTDDALNEMTSSIISGGSSKGSYYDDLGNLTRKFTACTTPNCMTYGGTGFGPHQLASLSGSFNGHTNPNFTYDANGNMTGGAGRVLKWTSYNMLSHIGVGTSTLDFQYDFNHSRVTETSNTGDVTTYLNDPITGAGSEQFVSGGTTTWRDYIVAGGHIVAIRTTTGGTSTWLYPAQDHLGSLTALTKTNGNVLEQQSYDPWGKRRQLNGNDDPNCALPSASTRGFTGEEMLDGFCLVNLNGRIYDPVLGRFLSPDTIVPDPANGLDLNRYAYTENNPVNATDRTGHITCQQTANGQVCKPTAGECFICDGPGFTTDDYGNVLSADSQAFGEWTVTGYNINDDKVFSYTFSARMSDAAAMIGGEVSDILDQNAGLSDSSGNAMASSLGASINYSGGMPPDTCLGCQPSVETVVVTAARLPDPVLTAGPVPNQTELGLLENNWLPPDDPFQQSVDRAVIKAFKKINGISFAGGAGPAVEGGCQSSNACQFAFGAGEGLSVKLDIDADADLIAPVQVGQISGAQVVAQWQVGIIFGVTVTSVISQNGSSLSVTGSFPVFGESTFVGVGAASAGH